MLDLVVGWVLKPVRERDSVLLLDLGGLDIFYWF